MKLKQTVVSLSIITVLSGALALSWTATSGALTCGILDQTICDSANSNELQSSGVWQLLMLVLRTLTAAIGIVAVGAIAYAGFLYATAQSNASQVEKSKEMIRNTLIGIALYGLMYAATEFLIPGGVFT